MIDIDATLVESHSDKQAAAGTYKGGFGFHPLMAYLDATGEALAGLLRPGNAGSNTAADHIEVLDDALAQLPVDPRSTEVVTRADCAGSSEHDVTSELAQLYWSMTLIRPSVSEMRQYLNLACAS